MHYKILENVCQLKIIMDNSAGSKSASEVGDKAEITASKTLDPNEDNLDDLDGPSYLLSAFEPY